MSTGKGKNVGEGSNSLNSLVVVDDHSHGQQQKQQQQQQEFQRVDVGGITPPPVSWYESQKRRDWKTFEYYLRCQRPPLAISQCNSSHVLDFLRYIDQFGKTKVHLNGCGFYGQPEPPGPCTCPLRQAWGSLDALIGRLRAAYEENGGSSDTNPFATSAIRIYLREVEDYQSKARGSPYKKKKKKKNPTNSTHHHHQVVVDDHSHGQQQHQQQEFQRADEGGITPPSVSRYESQKRRDWKTFECYLRCQSPPLAISQCNSSHVLDFLRYIDQFGKTKVHLNGCSFYGHPEPPGPCTCPLRQAWGSLDALIGRLRAAYEENGGSSDTNPFATGAIRIYLREVEDSQSKARGSPYKKKKKKKNPTNSTHHHHQGA